MSGHPEPPTSPLGRRWDAALIRVATAVLRRGSPAPASGSRRACGMITEKLPLSIREWTCRCGAVHDRDVNAARVIHAAGLAVSACGDGVRPTRT